jgi:DNA-binding transcriptional LysR family regulator
VRAAVATAVSGCGLTRLYSYHVAEYVKDGRLKIVLADAEHPPLPVHLLTPPGRMAVPKVPAFIDFAVPRFAFRVCSHRGRRGNTSPLIVPTRG